MFWLGPFEYKSKKELLDQLKDYLQNAPVGVITNKLAVKKLHLLIACIPKRAEKLLSGLTTSGSREIPWEPCESAK